MLSTKPEVIKATEIDDESIVLLENTICEDAVTAEEIIVVSADGFNNRISNIKAHDISLKLKDDNGKPFIHYKSIHYIDDSKKNFFVVDVEVDKVVFIGNTIVLEDYKTLNRVSITFYTKPITEFVQYYDNFNIVKSIIYDKLKALLSIKGSLFMYSDTPFIPIYFAEGELTMSAKGWFKRIEKIDFGLALDEKCKENNTIPTYGFFFDITYVNDKNERVRKEFKIDQVINVSIFSKKIMLYRSMGMPVYINFIEKG